MDPSCYSCVEAQQRSQPARCGVKVAKTSMHSGSQLWPSRSSQRRHAFSLPRAPSDRLRAAAVEFDVVVIGSGIGGLSSCASPGGGAGVCVLEAHYELGGCAHEYDVDLGQDDPEREAEAMDPRPPTFKFEAGPLYALLADRSPNPLKHVYQMIGRARVDYV